MKKILHRLAGGFDVLFLFGRGVTRFTGSRADAWGSMWIPALTLPVSLAFAAFYPPKGMETGFTTAQILITVAAQYALSFTATLLIVWAIATVLKRADKFWLFVEVGNWAALAMSLILVPLSLFAVFQPDYRAEMDRLFVIINAYGIIVTACIAYRSFQINWQLGGAIAIATMFVGQEIWNLLYWVQGIPDPW